MSNGVAGLPWRSPRLSGLSLSSAPSLLHRVSPCALFADVSHFHEEGSVSFGDTGTESCSCMRTEHAETTTRLDRISLMSSLIRRCPLSAQAYRVSVANDTGAYRRNHHFRWDYAGNCCRNGRCRRQWVRLLHGAYIMDFSFFFVHFVPQLTWDIQRPGDQLLSVRCAL